jgi:hypothetical protein
VRVGRDAAPGERVDVERIDHGAWNELLRKYVDDRGRVAYGAWKASAEDRRALEAYLSSLSGASASRAGSREARLAFWINAYNALTIHGILREYPTTSIRNHTARFLGYNIWKDLQLPVEDRAYSLHQIEHDVLRKMGEPRIHFAIVCASVGCPRLLNEAYTAEEVEDQLTRNAREFFADPAKFSFDAEGRVFSVSPILSWFAADFGATERDRLRTIAPWLPPDARAAAESGDVRFRYLPYDWSLNDRPAGAPPAKPNGAARAIIDEGGSSGDPD